MKKTALALIVASLFIISCGGGGKTEAKSSDSTKVAVDTTKVVDSVKIVK